MARTRDVLDELAAWYAPPECATSAGAGALPAPFTPLVGIESWRSSAGGGLASVVQALRTWHDRGRQRRALSRLSDHMLRDIGISRAEALDEAAKPFWRG